MEPLSSSVIAAMNSRPSGTSAGVIRSDNVRQDRNSVDGDCFSEGDMDSSLATDRKTSLCNRPDRVEKSLLSLCLNFIILCAFFQQYDVVPPTACDLLRLLFNYYDVEG